MSHTKGPWIRKSIPGHLFELADTEGNPVMRIRGGMMPTLEDARLMEAAPELLAALRQCYSDLQRYAPTSAGSVAARAAIEKAKGAP